MLCCFHGPVIGPIEVFFMCVVIGFTMWILTQIRRKPATHNTQAILDRPSFLQPSDVLGMPLAPMFHDARPPAPETVAQNRSTGGDIFPRAMTLIAGAILFLAVFAHSGPIFWPNETPTNWNHLAVGGSAPRIDLALFSYQDCFGSPNTVFLPGDIEHYEQERRASRAFYQNSIFSHYYWP